MTLSLDNVGDGMLGPSLDVVTIVDVVTVIDVVTIVDVVTVIDVVDAGCGLSLSASESGLGDSPLRC